MKQLNLQWCHLPNVKMTPGSASPFCANCVSHIALRCPERAGVGAAALERHDREHWLLKTSR